MTDRRVKIVLPCTNEGEWLRVTVDSILEKTDYPSFEVFILANGDEVTDFSFIERPAYRQRVRLERVEESLGVGRSINAAVEPGDAAYYVFLDAHSLVEQRDWLERVVDCLETHPNACMVQPEVQQFSYEDEIPPGGQIDPDRIEKGILAYSITWAWPYEKLWDIAWVHTYPRSHEPYEAMAGGGMAVLTRSEMFHRLGKHDPEVAGWWPKTRDYCLHGWMLGYPMMVDPSIRVLHRVKTRRRTYPSQTLHMVHGILRTAYKYLSPRRRDLTELLFRRHGLDADVDEALRRIEKGRWLEERAEMLRNRVHSDDWLFSKFGVYEERFADSGL